MPKLRNQLLTLFLLLSSGGGGGGGGVRAGVSLDAVAGSYVFFFNLEPSAKTMCTSALNNFIESTLNGILPSEATLKSFHLASIEGFVVNNIGESHFQQLSQATSNLGGQGIPNYIMLGHAGEEIAQNTMFGSSNVRITATQLNGGCLPRPIYPGMHGLDWLDLTVGSGTYCGPTFSDDKFDLFVLDTGVQQDHPDFSHTQVYLDDCADVGAVNWIPYVDVNGHGTRIAGVAGSFPFGVTPNARIRSIKVLDDSGSSTVSSQLCGLSKVENWLIANPTKRAVINLSLAFSGIISALDSAMSSLLLTYQSRLVAVACAGSSNNNACLYTFSSIPEAIVVGSVDINLFMSTVSNFGSCVDIFASGENIVTTAIGGKHTTSSGCGMAVAQVSGVIAQYMLDNPAVTGLQIRQMIENNAASALHAANMLSGTLPPGTPNKLIKYTCADGCPVPGECASSHCSSHGLCFNLPEGHFCLCDFGFGEDDCGTLTDHCVSMPCINGGCCTHSAAGYTCTCPVFTTGTRCETPICRFLGNLSNANLCKRYYCCKDGKKYDLQCRKHNGIQYLFDITSRSCKPPSEANTVPGCI